MALRKEKISKFGFTMDYWKVMVIYFDTYNKWVDITIVPFVSKEARDTGLAPIYDEQIVIHIRYDTQNRDYDDYFAPGVLNQYNEDMIELTYRYIKDKCPELEGAEDC